VQKLVDQSGGFGCMLVMGCEWANPQATWRSWELLAESITRTDTARETNAAARLYGIVENGDLAYAEERALRGLPTKPHLSAQLKLK